MATEPDIIIVPGSSLPEQPWWRELHATINEAFFDKGGIEAYPPTWTRLPSNAYEGAERLRDELGPEGLLAVVLVGDRPIACAGALTFRGLNWINEERSVGEDASNTDTQLDAGHNVKASECISPTQGDFEICCLCIHPLHRRSGLSHRIIRILEDHLKLMGAKRLFANYVIEETGQYWPKMGFATIPGAGGVLKKGFTHTEGMEALRQDLHFAMGVKDI